MIYISYMAGNAAGVAPVKMTGIAGGVLVETEIKMLGMTARGQGCTRIAHMAAGTVTTGAGFYGASERRAPCRANSIGGRISRVRHPLSGAVTVAAGAGSIWAGYRLVSWVTKIKRSIIVYINIAVKMLNRSRRIRHRAVMAAAASGQAQVDRVAGGCRCGCMAAAAVQCKTRIMPAVLDTRYRSAGAILMAGITDIGLGKIVQTVAVGIGSRFKVGNVPMTGRAADAWKRKMLRVLAAGRHTMVLVPHLVGVTGGAVSTAGRNTRLQVRNSGMAEAAIAIMCYINRSICSSARIMTSRT